jgi:hypothetical protein
MGLTVLRDAASAIVIDDSARGIVIATWFGEPTVALVDRYFDWHATYLDRLRKERGRFVTITDAFATARPSPSARKRIAERMDALGPDVQELTVASYVIFESALIRGVITALAWLHAPLAETIAVASPALAIGAALRDLDAAGIPRPTNLSAATYKRPAKP